MKSLLEKLVKRQNLTREEAAAFMEVVAQGKAEPAQVGAFLALLASKGESAQEISAFAKVMRKHMITVNLDCSVLDIVGTGGDGMNTINISTAAAILCAACGAKVAKHGSKSVSSKSGSSDVLQKLGIALLGPPHIETCIREAGIAFMFAPLFHPAMAHVVPIRQSLGIRTVFNILGPLLNPAGAQRLMLGVFSPDLLDKYGEVVQQLGAEHALIVHCCGMDELSAVGPAEAVEVRKGQPVRRLSIDPLDIGVPRCKIEDLVGGEPEENARIIKEVFSGSPTHGAIADTIALNAGAALYVYGIAGSIQDGYRLARDKLKSGGALAVLERFASVSTSLEKGDPIVKKCK